MGHAMVLTPHESVVWLHPLPCRHNATCAQASEEEFKNASEAYGVLADMEQRKIYDRTLGVRKVNSSSKRWDPLVPRCRLLVIVSFYEN